MSKKPSNRGTIQVSKELLLRFKTVAKPKGYAIGPLVESFIEEWLKRRTK